jgi:hypothetical protein
VESVGTARLTDRITAERAVAASISRREIRDVLQDADGTPELTLELVAGDGSREHGMVSMTWSRDDLEKLLEGESGDDVVLTFDRNELAAALDDVEAHGLRARAAVFAVAAVGALGSTAAVAYASPVATGGVGMSQSSSSPTDTMVTDASTGGYAAPSQSDAAALAALQARSEAMDAQLATGGASSDRTVAGASTAAASQSDAAALAALQARSEAMDAQLATGDASSVGMVTDASTGGYATPATSADAAALQARSRALDAQYGLTAADQSAVNALAARGEAMNAQYGLGDSGATGIVTDASTGGGYATPTATGGGGGFEIQAPSTDDALLAGAALLVIAGAGFAARRGGSRLRRA